VFAALQLQAMKEKELEETADSDALTNDTNARSAMDDTNARNAMPAVSHEDMPLVSLVSPHTHMCM